MTLWHRVLRTVASLRWLARRAFKDLVLIRIVNTTVINPIQHIEHPAPQASATLARRERPTKKCLCCQQNTAQSVWCVTCSIMVHYTKWDREKVRAFIAKSSCN